MLSHCRQFLQVLFHLLLKHHHPHRHHELNYSHHLYYPVLKFLHRL
jgi:hypothetical protein